MSDSTSREQRAKALEERKRRLEEMRNRRNRRDETSSKSSNLDEYIDGLLSQEQPVALAPGPETELSQTEGGVINGDPVADGKDSTTTTTGDGLAAVTDQNIIAVSAPPPAPKNVETFTVSTQTEIEDFPEKPTTSPPEEASGLDEGETSTEKITENEENATEADQHQNRDPNPRLLSEEELEKEITMPPFSTFLNTSSKKVERLLGSSTDVSKLLVNYVGENDDKTLNDQTNANNDAFEKCISSSQIFECPKWTQGRDITDLDWSTLHREFVLSTYASPRTFHKSAAVTAVSPKETLSSSLTPRSGELQSEGLALVWSLSMPQRPEHIFTCGSPITTGRFHPTEATLVLGGCESGQLVIWDVRAGRLPVQKSSIMGTTKGHSQPINCMRVVDGGTALVTSSSDGRVNYWSLSNLRDPAESIQVGDSLSTFSIAPESESIIAGDDYGSMYAIVGSSSGSSSGRSSRKQVRKLTTVTEEGENLGHYGMITAVSTKTLKRTNANRVDNLSKGFLRGSGGLVLSSGVDWSVKLWSPAHSDFPLATFVNHSYDYVADVQWSPAHPTLFATACSNGSLGLWNLASSFDEALTGQDGIAVDTEEGRGDSGLSRLKWSPEGRRLIAASGDRMYALTLKEEVTRVKGDEDNKLMNDLMARGLIIRQ